MVAPLVGAWIEIFAKFSKKLFTLSLPSWERGLKFHLTAQICFARESLPSWERGLKSGSKDIWYKFHSRSPRGSVD